MHFTGSRTPGRYPLALALLAALAASGAAKASEAWYLSYRHWQAYDWPEHATYASEVSRSQRALGWRRQVTGGDLGLDYDYQPLRLRAGEPAHNGHLHRVTAGGQWQWGRYRMAARAGLAGTSNLFKYQDFHHKAVNGQVAAFRALADGSPFSVGIGGDHRFGSFGWLPRLRWASTTGQGHWLVDLPVLLRWQSPDQKLAARIERVGDRWATLDSNRVVESALYLREWRAELTYRVSPARRWRPGVTLGLGGSLDTRVEYRDLGLGTVDRTLGDALFGRIRLEW
ncbi:MAG: hypothetical protein VX324_06290 [Pseudomonadota bacterium]|nr:hypothetical protein [Pseudomonadota bacterium]